MVTNIIEGNPTKKFFIEMITRDISIEDAIIDLLDNSIDGANRINPNDYSGLNIYLIVNEEYFEIKDNCGGFSIDTAKRYAFRFGRPEDAPKGNGTVGRFGIGMKRSLFKIGKAFTVESQFKQDSFKVEVDVDKWSKKVRTIKNEDGSSDIIDDWSFTYIEIPNTGTEDGTSIRISNLNPEVRNLFADEGFLTTLADNIQKLLNFSLQKGLTIYLNGKPLSGKRVELLLSDILGTDPDVTSRNIEDEVDKKLLKASILKLNPREKNIMEMRFGFITGKEKTQKEVADELRDISKLYLKIGKKDNT